MKKFSFNLTLFIFIISLAASAYAEEIKVIPIGKAVGIRIYTDGLLVIGTSEINGENAAKKNGIKVNDRITQINGKEVSTTDEFSKTVNEHPDGVNLEIVRDNRNIEINAVPVLSEDNIYRLGLWVRDSTAGIGTVTYYDPSGKSFAALGHAINDVDTGNILSVKSGNILDCDILSVTKGQKGSPGELNGTFNGNIIGDVKVNAKTGVFGKMLSDSFLDYSNPVPVAAKEQVHEGEAYIMSDAFGNNTEQYSIEINKITDDSDKGLIIEITDKRLIDRSGGIVQGMSGSPIIQDGRLVGAVTHVFVNNPLKGYGTLAENMIDAQRNANI